MSPQQLEPLEDYLELERALRLIRHAIIHTAQTPELLKLKSIVESEQVKGWDPHLCIPLPDAEYRVIELEADQLNSVSGFCIHPHDARKHGLDAKALERELEEALRGLLDASPAAAPHTRTTEREGWLARFIPYQNITSPLLHYADSQFGELVQKAIAVPHPEIERAVRHANGGHRRMQDSEAGMQAAWANVLNEGHGEGTYFSAEKLAEFAAGAPWPEYLFKSFDQPGQPVAGLETRQELLRQAAEFLRPLGLRRMQYFADGASTIVFSTIPDSTGKMQLVLLTPSGEEPIPHPAMLPDKKIGTVSANGFGLDVRVSPELDNTSSTEEETRALAEWFTRSGLDPWDLLPDGKPKVNNVLIVETQDGRRLLYCADRDAVRWPAHMSPSERAERVAEWERDSDFDTYREVTTRLMTGYQVENAFDAILVEKVTRQGLRPEIPTQQSTLKTAIQRGLYPAEVQALSQAALAESADAEDMGEAWLDTFRSAVREHDTSIAPAHTVQSVALRIAADTVSPADRPISLAAKVSR